jgi:hypothetical protein
LSVPEFIAPEGNLGKYLPVNHKTAGAKAHSATLPKPETAIGNVKTLNLGFHNADKRWFINHVAIQA